jgi:hypothetical protein
MHRLLLNITNALVLLLSVLVSHSDAFSIRHHIATRSSSVLLKYPPSYSFDDYKLNSVIFPVITTRPMKTLNTPTTLYSSSNMDMDPIISEAALKLKRLNWFSWWSQVILTVVSSITLLFARSVLQAGKSNRSELVTGGFFLAGSGITVSFLSIIWTWGGTRLSRRILRKSEEYSRIRVASVIRRTVKVGAMLNLFGMLFTLIGAEQIIGLLAAKILTTQGANPFTSNAQILGGQVTPFNAIDILIVQANTNTLVSHFVSLVCALSMTKSVGKLDPPSSEDDPR